MDLGGGQSLDNRVDLLVVVSQAALGVLVRSRETGDVAVPLLGLETRSGSNTGVGVGWGDGRRVELGGGLLLVLLEDGAGEMGSIDGAGVVV